MSKTTQLAAILAAIFAFGCGAEEVTTAEGPSVGDYDRQAGSGEIIGAGDACPILTPLEGFGGDPSLFDVTYDGEGRVVSSSYDRDADGVADTSCTYGYRDGQLVLVLGDFDLDGEADAWEYVEDPKRDAIGERRHW